MADESSAQYGEVFQGENSEWYWHVKGGNNKVVANSDPESYTRREDAVRAIEDVFPEIPIRATTVVNESTEGGNSMNEEQQPQPEPDAEPQPTPGEGEPQPEGQPAPEPQEQ